MISRHVKLFIVLTTCFCTLAGLEAQPPEPSKIITVRDGLPQSFVSGIFQDQNGFLWIATLNGFSRYDGRGFKYYQHSFSDSSGLSGNIILHLFNAGNDELLLGYIDGKMDLFNAVSGRIVHLWQNKSFDPLRTESAYFKSLVTDGRGICWMIANDGGIYRIDLTAIKVTHFSAADLKLPEPIVGIAIQKQTLLLFTKTTMSVRNGELAIIKNVSYPFHTINTFNTGVVSIYSPTIRSNGDLIISDSDGIKIWNPSSGSFHQQLLKKAGGPVKLISHFVLDLAGN